MCTYFARERTRGRRLETCSSTELAGLALIASSYVGAVIVPPGVIVNATRSELGGNFCLLKGL